MIERLSGIVAPEKSDAIARILAQAFDAPDLRWSAQAVAGTLSLPGTVAFLAGGQADAQACAILRIIADEAELLTLAVLPDARRQGLGTKLLAACLSEAAQADAVRLHLEVGASNAAARALYARAGFAETGRRAGYFRAAGGREDAVLMTCDMSLI